MYYTMRCIVDLCIPFTVLSAQEIEDLFGSIHVSIQGIRLFPTCSNKLSGNVVFLHFDHEPTAEWMEKITTIQEKGHATLGSLTLKIAHKQPSNTTLFVKTIDEKQQRSQEHLRSYKEQKRFQHEMLKYKNNYTNTI